MHLFPIRNLLRKIPPIGMNLLTQVNLFIQDHQTGTNFQEKWDIPRTLKTSYLTELPFNKDNEEIPEEAFNFTNNPRFQEKPDRLPKGLQNYQGPSLSVGDLVEIVDPNKKETQLFLCKITGWEKK